MQRYLKHADGTETRRHLSISHGEGSNPVALPPPVPIRAALSARPTAALSGRFPGVFGVDLLTGPARRRPKIALRRPILSGPPDLAVLVRNSKTQINGRFQRGRRLLWFEPHLPEIRTSRANTSVRKTSNEDTIGRREQSDDAYAVRFGWRASWSTSSTSTTNRCKSARISCTEITPRQVSRPRS